MKEIKNGMQIVDCKERHLGFVDEVFPEGYIKLSRRDAPPGRHGFLRVTHIDRLEGDRVVLAIDQDEFLDELLDELPHSDWPQRILA